MHFKLFASERDEKTKVKMNQPVYLGMSILGIRKMLMYKFSYDYVKLKYEDKAKLSTTLKMMLENGLIHLTIKRMTKDHFQQV